MTENENINFSNLPEYKKKFYNLRIAYGYSKDEAMKALVEFDKWCDEYIEKNTTNEYGNKIK
ncbi:hypothetical protein IJG72_06330 [bacterium]|nr:hypothetical protein [bacterium]